MNCIRLSAHCPPDTTRQHWKSGHWRIRRLSIPLADDVAPRRRKNCRE
jgi:hypothetical protein